MRDVWSVEDLSPLRETLRVQVSVGLQDKCLTALVGCHDSSAKSFLVVDEVCMLDDALGHVVLLTTRHDDLFHLVGFARLKDENSVSLLDDVVSLVSEE